MYLALKMSGHSKVTHAAFTTKRNIILLIFLISAELDLHRSHNLKTVELCPLHYIVEISMNYILLQPLIN